MRKKLAILFLSLALLTACSAAPAAVQPTQSSPVAVSTEPPSAVSTEPPSAAAPIQGEDSEEELRTEQTETPEDLLNAPVFPDSDPDQWEEDPDQWEEDPDAWEEDPEPDPELAPALEGQETPPGGFRVLTDYSAYSPYQAQKPVYTRLRSGWIDSFSPSPDDGAVYPFCGARLFYAEDPKGYSSICGELMGIIDSRGRILTDPVYTGVYPMVRYDWNRETVTSRPWWVVSQTGEIQPQFWENDDGSSYTWYEGTERFGVISFDGSKALPCDFSRITALERGFAAIELDEALGFRVYDDDGTLRFTDADLNFHPQTQWWNVDYGEGFYVITSSRLNEAQAYENEVWLYDPDSGTYLGPYWDAEPFSEGLACVSLERNGPYGYIDKTGAWVLAPNYGQQASFDRGVALQRDLEDHGIALDRGGEILLRAPAEGWMEPALCGFCLVRPKGENYFHEFYDPSGRLLISGNSTLRCLDEDTFWWTDWNAGKTHIKRLSTGQELKLAQQDWINTGCFERNGEIVQGYRCQRYDQDLTTYVPLDLSGSSQRKNGGRGDAYQTQVEDPFTGETWYLERDAGGWTGSSDGGRRLRLPYRSDSLSIYGDLVQFTTEDACICTDLEGKLLFRYPLDAED